VPAQFRVMQRRPDGDIEWVCVDFLADVAANAAAVYHLTDTGPGKPVDKPVAVQDAADSLVITNGPLKFAISKKSFTGLGHLRPLSVTLFQSTADDLAELSVKIASTA